MAKCTQSVKDQCKRQGKVCNPKTGKCKVSEKAKAAQKSAPRRGRSPSRGRSPTPVGTQTAVSAIIKNVGTSTAVSLAKGKSKRLGAGMASMVSMVKERAGRSTRAVHSGAGKHYGARKAHTHAKETHRVAAGKTCTKTCPAKRPVLSKLSCRCYAPKSAAARKAGVCLPRVGKDGRRYETVLKKGTYGPGSKMQGKTYHRCVKAGSSTAKAALHTQGCPSGKVLVQAPRKVPQWTGPKGSRRRLTGPGATKTVMTQRCIFPRGSKHDSIKDCPMDKVLAQMRGGKRCVKRSTATAKGYPVVRAGTLPIKTFRVSRRGVAMSMGRRA